MVARIAKLRLALLTSYFRGKPKQLLKRFVWAALALGISFLLTWLPLLLTKQNGLELHEFDLLFGGVALAFVFLVPFFISRWNLQTRSFGFVPEKPQATALAIFLTVFISWPFLWLIASLAFWIVLRPDLNLTPLNVLAILLTLVMVPVSARFSRSLSELIFDTERRRNFLKAAGVVLSLTLLPVLLYIFLLSSSASQASSLRDLLSVLAWTPFGAPFQALNPDIDSATPLALIAGGTLLFALLGILLMIRELTTVPRPEVSILKQAKLGWFAVFPLKPAGAIGARSMIYWLKDPRYRVSLFAIPVIPFVIVAILKFVGVSVSVLAFFPLPIVLIMMAWMIHNDVSHDSTAFWLHVSSGIKGWQDRFGRIIPVLLLGTPILLVGSAVSAIIYGDWRLVPSFFALGFTALSASLAVSSVFSILLPYPATRPGESPFAQPQWQGAGSGFAQTASFVISVALIIPVVWVIALWAANPELEQQLMLTIGSMIYGVSLLLFGITVGGAIFRLRSADVLTLSQVYD